MQLQDHVAHLQDRLVAAAALGDEPTRRIAVALAAAAEPAMRLALLDAITAAAEDITAALLDAPGAPGVSVRIDGDEVRMDVHSTDVPEPAHQGATDDGEASARISLRLSESLKSEIETAARRDSISVNTWLVRAAAAALGASARRGTDDRRQGPDHHRISGWINS